MSVAVGLLLVSAAALKLIGLQTSPVAALNWLADPFVQAGAVAAELTLAVWLLSNVAPQPAWLASVGLFALFALVSGRAALAGQAACDCFGPLTVNPWWTLALDTGVLAAQLIVRPANVGSWFLGLLQRWRSWVPAAAAASAVCLAAWYTDGVHRLLAVVRDDPLVVRPSTIDAGSVLAGNVALYEFDVVNRSPRTVRLVGAPSTCRCLVVEGLPAELAPGESRALIVRVYFGEQPGLFDQRFQLYLADGSLLRLNCQVTARVRPRQPPDEPEP